MRLSTNTVCTPLLCQPISLFALTLQKSPALVRLNLSESPAQLLYIEVLS